MGIKVTPLRGYSLEPIFYVYLHKRPIEGTVFYVGKGKNKRAWITKSRNPHWQHVVDKHGGFEVEIVKDKLTEQEAFTLEAEIVLQYGIENLTNQTLGGISTTGMVHTQETRELQSRICKQKLEENPERLRQLTSRLEAMHEKQRNDPEYKARLSASYSRYYENLTPEERAEVVERKTGWLKDPERVKQAVEKGKVKRQSKEYLDRARQIGISIWENMSEEELNHRKAIASNTISQPDLKAKLLEIRSKKVVLNNKYLFNSINQLTEYLKLPGIGLNHSISRARKLGFNFTVYQGYYVELYSKEKHLSVCDIPANLEIKKISIPSLTLKKVLINNESKLFLTRKEASLYCIGEVTESAMDWITKRMNEGKEAFGYSWRFASKEEINLEISRRIAEEVFNV